MRISVGDLAALVGGSVEGPADVPVTGVATVDDAVDGDVVLAEDDRYFSLAAASKAACIIAGPGVGDCPRKSVIRAADPAGAFVEVLRRFERPAARPDVGAGPGTVIEPGASIGQGVAIGANCFIARGAAIGDRCVLYPNVYVGAEVSVGEDCVIHHGVTLYPRCSVGKRVILHAGVVLGSDGFGYRPGRAGLEKYPHIGTVEVGDDVEIGANSAVDRAKTGATIIGKGTKIDNLVHIAHNVKIGANCVVVALSGIAGSVTVGNGVTLAAQTGVKDHVRIGDGCVVAARAGVIGDLPSGSVVSGFPAREHNLEKRVEAARLHLPDVLRRLRKLENEIRDLRLRGEESGNDNSDN